MATLTVSKSALFAALYGHDSPESQEIRTLLTKSVALNTRPILISPKSLAPSSLAVPGTDSTTTYSIISPESYCSGNSTSH